MNRRWLAGTLVLGIVTVALGVASERLPVLKTFHLTYTTLPLDESGAVNRTNPPTRYFYKGHRSRIDNFT
ncbi:MAG TPA: hypothetical protein VM737_06600, partial [Gemmatimonadota bacterium]|nr:hypothetical protein [Gemmatimonadota bacterium]